MRCRVRMSLVLLGLALAVPVSGWADGPPTSSRPKPKQKAQPPHKQGRGLFSSPCMCPDCQRKRVKERDGVNMPPPPTIPGMAAAGDCAACQGKAHNAVMVANGPISVGQPVPVPASSAPMFMAGNGNPPGYAVAGGESIPGYAVIGGQVPMAEPAPIGMVQARPYAGAMPGQAPAAQRGQTDPSLMPSAFAQDTITAPKSGRPHVLSHVLGFDTIGRERGEERARRKRENHAAIPYGPLNQVVNEVPASMVYGRGH